MTAGGFALTLAPIRLRKAKHMRNLPKAILAAAVLVASGTAVQAQKLALPGKTLRLTSATGVQQPVHNAKNALGVPVTPDCPHIGKSLRDLLNYARISHPSLYRQALALRRTGFTQEDVRIWLEGQICTAEA